MIASVDANSDAPAPGRPPRGAGGALAALVVVATAWGCSAPPVAEIPLPDLAEAEPVVAEAVRAARARVEAEPHSAEAWGDYGLRLSAHHWSDEAARCYAAAAELAPREFLWPYLLGLSRLRPDPAGAAEALERALAIDEAYPPAQVYYAQTLVRLGRFGEAREHFARARELDPASSHAELGLGQLALSDGRADEARRHLERAVELQPDHREAHQSLAQVWLALGDETRATRHAERALKLPDTLPVEDPRLAERRVEPVGSKSYNEVGKTLMAAGRLDEAMRHFRRAIELKPDAAEPRYHLGTALARSGRTDEAIEQLSEAVRIRPNLAVAHVNLGIALAARGDLLRAESHLREALRTKPDDAQALLNLAAVLAGREGYGEAEQLLLRARASSPDDPDVRFALAGVLDASGRKAESASEYREALRLRPGWPAPSKRLAWVLATSRHDGVRRPQEAADLAERWCRATDFRDPLALDALAAARAADGSFDEAARLAAQAVELATAAGNRDLAAAVGGRLRLYRSGRPYRE